MTFTGPNFDPSSYETDYRSSMAALTDAVWSKFDISPDGVGTLPIGPDGKLKYGSVIKQYTHNGGFLGATQQRQVTRDGSLGRVLSDSFIVQRLLPTPDLGSVRDHLVYRSKGDFSSGATLLMERRRHDTSDSNFANITDANLVMALKKIIDESEKLHRIRASRVIHQHNRSSDLNGLSVGRDNSIPQYSKLYWVRLILGDLG